MTKNNPQHQEETDVLEAKINENGLILYYTWTWRYDPVLQKDIYVRYGHWYVRDN